MIYQVNRFHLLVLFTWQFTIFYASQMIFPIFSHYEPEFRCGNDPASRNCEELTKCNGSVTFNNIEFHSMIHELDWKCEKKYMATLFTLVQFAGVLLGTISFGMASDAFGRKPISILALTLGLIAAFVSVVVSSEYAQIVLRFVVGLSIGGTLVVVCTFVMEMLLPQQRMALRAFFNWGVARLILTLICMWTREWRAALFVCMLVSVPALVIIILVFPESPTWLHSKGRLADMVESEKTIARRAGIPYQPVPHRKIQKTKTLCQVMSKRETLRRLLVLWFMWFTAATCGYATDLNSNTISGDLYKNQILFSILIWISKMVLVVVDTHVPWFTRRMLHQGAQLGAVICFGILSVLTAINDKSQMTLVSSLLGTVFVEYTWDACYLCAVESMETSGRASATGSCSLVARVGALFAPWLAHLNMYWGASLYVVVVVMGTLNLLLSYVMLVETKGIVLDDVTIDEEEKTVEEAVPLN